MVASKYILSELYFEITKWGRSPRNIIANVLYFNLDVIEFDLLSR